MKGALLILLGLALLRRSSPAGAAATVRLRCDPDPSDTWGGRWGEERPPGLPWNARRPCEQFSGLPLVRRVADSERLGGTFTELVAHLSETESNATPGLPARPPYRADQGWGIFQFNEGAWHSMAQPWYGCGPPGPPELRHENAWEASLEEEVGVPIRMYACLFRRVRDSGGSSLDASRGVRLWHTGSSYYRTYLERAAETGSFAAAWNDLLRFPPTDRFYRSLANTDGRMREIGLL